MFKILLSALVLSALAVPPALAQQITCSPVVANGVEIPHTLSCGERLYQVVDGTLVPLDTNTRQQPQQVVSSRQSPQKPSFSDKLMEKGAERVINGLFKKIGF